MKCPHCGSDRITEKANFCGSCGKKLKTVCNCWIKKGSYNCGEDSCPGYELLVKEAKIASQARSRTQSQTGEREEYKQC